MEKTKVLLSITEQDNKILTEYAKAHGVSRNAVIVNAIQGFIDTITQKDRMLNVIEEALTKSLSSIQAAKNDEGITNGIK